MSIGSVRILEMKEERTLIIRKKFKINWLMDPFARKG